MSLIALILLLLWTLLFGTSSFDGGGTESQSQACAVAAGDEQRCGPTLVNDQYQVPVSGTVIHAVVNVGPLPPEYQEGYEITIDATGVATVVVTPLGASDDLGDAATREPIVTTVDLGPDGLQNLLRDLDNSGFFYLPTTESLDETDVPIGGDVSNLTIKLIDDVWEVPGAALTSDDRETLDHAQRLLVIAVGLDPDNPTSNPDLATPVAM
jgi:hypothetical protein